jgi:hypothetical protein
MLVELFLQPVKGQNRTTASFRRLGILPGTPSGWCGPKVEPPVYLSPEVAIPLHRYGPAHGSRHRSCQWSERDRRCVCHSHRFWSNARVRNGADEQSPTACSSHSPPSYRFL